jgi:beta-carotene 3-hydroxylase
MTAVMSAGFVGAALIVLAALVTMEAVSYLTHRFVMHGFGFGLHKSHHVNRDGGFEMNDLYPMMFSSVAILSFTAGTFLPAVRPLVLVGIGITLYGVAYLFVHEIYIHRRMWTIRRRYRLLEWMKASHRIHHLFGGEPFGMLLPIVPRALRERAAAVPYEPDVDVRLTRRPGARRPAAA